MNDWNLLDRINREVNTQILYMTDLEQYGVPEYWTFNPPSNRGDCEDYALTKLNRLASARFSLARMKIYVVEIQAGTFAGTYHAVLVIDDKWVLDNLSNDILEFTKLPYKRLRVYRP